jgi:alkanesulfonate monooxygenase SsuD/methylene tetrahydromethanopterin reductase-like flavin-dependent oxidoreductase (luciferase family)
MKFFLSGLSNFSMNLALITDAFIEADKLGFDGALMPDHYMWGRMQFMRRGREGGGGHPGGNVMHGMMGSGSHPGGNVMHGMMGSGSHPGGNNATLETWVMLSYLAGKTRQIRLGTLVTPIPFRPPGILAKMVSTLDILSNGRVVLGVGAGWSQEEFEGYSEWNEPKVRVDKTKEGLELMIKLWTQDTVTFEGKYYRMKAAVLEPKPVQKPYPQLMFGGRGDRMLKLAGKYADICYIMSQTPEDYEKMKDKVLMAAKRTKRADKIAFMAGAMGSRTPYDSMEYIKRVETAVETGANYFLTAFPRTEFIDAMRSFSKEVMPSFK